MKRLLSMLALLSLLTLIGCGGSGEKGKNKGKDVPKPAETKPQ